MDSATRHSAKPGGFWTLPRVGVKPAGFYSNLWQNECETYHYADDDSFIASSSGFGGYLVKNTFDKNHRLLKGEIFNGSKLIEWVTVEYKFDSHGNVIEEVVYNKNGVWKTKITHQYKYYE